MSAHTALDRVAARLGVLRSKLRLLMEPGTLVHLDSDVDGTTAAPEYPTTIPHDEGLESDLASDVGVIVSAAELQGFDWGKDEYVWVTLREVANGWEFAKVDVELGRLLRGAGR